MVAPLKRKNGWTLAEEAGHAGPDRIHRLLNRVEWDADEVLDNVRGYVVDHLGMLPDRQAAMRPGRLPGPPLPRLAPPHDPGHGRLRLPDRPAGPPVGHGQSRDGSSQLIHLSLAEPKSDA
ncbi:hypothetical protein TUSST3_55550 [Streptomyces sp. TUS-ST3]|nr:hypothetical protein TUSST3_55550 [Streptomyces sp. TUS-ST3]